MHSKLWIGPPFGPPLFSSRPPTRKSNSRGPLSHSLGPTNHCALALGSANALNTSAGEALKVRSTTKVACTTDDLAMDYSFAFDSGKYPSSRRSQMLRR